jgi:hypothetical protein
MKGPRFQIENICPHSKSPVKRNELLAIMPLTVPISAIPAVKAKDEECTGERFRIPRHSANRIRALVGLSPGETDFSVCEHMGHLIE